MILAILQARVSSTRLPGKVMKPILGRPMLSLQIERIQRSGLIDKMIVATSREDSDNDISILCEQMQIPCFRGSLNDVLDRFYQAAGQYEPEHIVRLTGDCPLIDPKIIDDVIDFYIKGNYDYVSNALNPTFPDGLDVEVFRYSVLQTVWRKAFLKEQREHVTPYIYQHEKQFYIGEYKNREDLSNLRWTVDEPEDYSLVRLIYEALYPGNPDFATQDIMDFLQQNVLLSRINSHITRNEGPGISHGAMH